jgi:hypothetical protein
MVEHFWPGYDRVDCDGNEWVVDVALKEHISLIEYEDDG